MASPDHSVTELIAAGRDREAAVRGLAIGQRAKGEAMDPLTQFGLLGPVVGGIVANITAAQLDLPTSCAQFTVRGVLEHMIGGAAMFAAAYRGELAATPALEDVLVEFPGALGQLEAAVNAPGALDRIIDAPFGRVDGETFARFVILDGLVHAWDLATATGQPCDPPDELVAVVHAFARETLDPLRDGQTFADAVEPVADATPIERLAAYTGRHPIAVAR